MSDFFSKPNLTGLRPGERVVVRHRIPRAEIDAAGLTDTVGEVLRRSDTHLVLRDRQGRDHTVAVADITAMRPVPPPTVAPGPRHLRTGIADLQRLGLSGLPPVHSQGLGAWVLRASEGYTGRGNSALALGDPGTTVAKALAATTDWYHALGQPALLQLTDDGSEHADSLRDQVSAAGWRLFQDTAVMTASVAVVLGAADAATAQRAQAARLRDEVDDTWFAGATERERQHRDVLTTMLQQVPRSRFAVLADSGGEVAAVGRSSLTPSWAGIFAVHVRPDLRGRGWGRAVMHALVQDAAAAGTESLYLQVSADNDPAVGLYASMGFTEHHTYCYAAEPGT
ncbi:GNAT family N-acetyltransferase [Dermacoccaceae bacterium W4C1]